jgi:hypothetical protein
MDVPDGRIRLSDAERDAAAADLGEHFASGRLTAEEHDERLDQIWAARTRSEIAPIFRDLPSAYAGVAAAPTRAASYERYWNAGPRMTWRRLPAPLLVVLALVVTLTVLTHLPFVLVGLAVWWFVAARHRGHRWHRTQGAHWR